MPNTRRDGKPQAPRSLHGKVAHELGLRIIRGLYPPGAVVPNETESSSRQRVSRTAYREALKLLTAKGLIGSRARAGTRVRAPFDWNMFDPDLLAWKFEAGIDEDFMRMLLEMRHVIEPSAAAIAARHRTGHDLARLRQTCAALAGPHRTCDDMVECDVQFHFSILAATQNPFMTSLASLIRTALAGAFRFASAVDSDATEFTTAAEHAAVLRAIERQDPKAAYRAMEVIIQLARGSLTKWAEGDSRRAVRSRAR